MDVLTIKTFWIVEEGEIPSLCRNGEIRFKWKSPTHPKERIPKQEKMSFAESSFIAVDASALPTTTFDHLPGKAYDLSKDVSRYQELIQTYSDQEARQLLLEEMTTDLITHFGELNRVGSFSYRYRIANNILVEDSPAEKPVARMFDNQDGVVAKLWQENIIPSLEIMPIGSIVFTYSARQIGTFEGGYDYAYLFQKIDSDTIHCHGLELVLNRNEQAAVLNHIYQDNNQPHLLLTDNPDPDEVRSRAFWFPSHTYESNAEAFSVLIGQVIKPLRSEWSLETKEDYESYLKAQEFKLEKEKVRAQKLASDLVAKINTHPLSVLENLLSSEQRHDLWQLYPQFMREAMLGRTNQIMLPCGSIDLDINGNNMSFTAGDGLVKTEAWSYHTGKCRHCHAVNVDVGPCEICRTCEKTL